MDVDLQALTVDLVLSIMARTVLFNTKSFAAASVKTKMFEDGGAPASAHWRTRFFQLLY